MNKVDRSVANIHLDPFTTKNFTEKANAGRKKGNPASVAARNLRKFLLGRERKWEEKMKELR